MTKEAPPISRAGNFKSAIHQILETGSNMITGEKSLYIAVMHTAEHERTEEMKEKIASALDCPELFITELTPVMGAHTGPNVVEVSFYYEDWFM